MGPGSVHGERVDDFDHRAFLTRLIIYRGICFTYATMFALESLALAGESHQNSESVRRACDFLVSKQMEDGGWGETYMVSRVQRDRKPNLMLEKQSCVSGTYSQHESSQAVQTAWVVLSLIYAKYPDKQVVRRAVELIMSRQQPVSQALRRCTPSILTLQSASNIGWKMAARRHRRHFQQELRYRLSQ